MKIKFVAIALAFFILVVFAQTIYSYQNNSTIFNGLALFAGECNCGVFEEQRQAYLKTMNEKKELSKEYDLEEYDLAQMIPVLENQLQEYDVEAQTGYNCPMIEDKLENHKGYLSLNQYELSVCNNEGDPIVAANLCREAQENIDLYEELIEEDEQELAECLEMAAQIHADLQVEIPQKKARLAFLQEQMPKLEAEAEELKEKANEMSELHGQCATSNMEFKTKLEEQIRALSKTKGEKQTQLTRTETERNDLDSKIKLTSTNATTIGIVESDIEYLEGTLQNAQEWFDRMSAIHEPGSPEYNSAESSVDGITESLERRQARLEELIANDLLIAEQLAQNKAKLTEFDDVTIPGLKEDIKDLGEQINELKSMKACEGGEFVDIEVEEPEEDLCANGELDPGEERIDCGGSCAPCVYNVRLSPLKPELFADGKTTQEFTITVTRLGEPVDGLSFNLSAKDVRSTLSIFDSDGRLSSSSVTTDSSGTARFTYTVPRAPEDKYFKTQSIMLYASGPSSKYTYIKLKDPKPKVKVRLQKRSMLEGKTGDEINYADVTIEDEDSEGWDIKVDTSIGGLISLTGSGGRVQTLIDRTDSTEYHFNWGPPVSGVELIDSYMEFVRDHKKDWSSYKSDMKDSVKDLVMDKLGEEAGEIIESGLASRPKLKKAYDIYGKSMDVMGEVGDFKDQYENWKGDVKAITHDIERIKTSTSGFEKFLRGLSIGVKGLHTVYGTKGFIESKLKPGEDDDAVTTFLNSMLDRTIQYGCDSLQTGLENYANTVREGNHETRRMPVKVIVEVTDEDGFKGKQTGLFEYVYYVAPGDT